jgi:4-hydroxy-tetrahydrodipicolinate synthase
VRVLLDNQRVIGIKDSSGNLEYFDEVLAIARARPDWSVFVGPEHLLADVVRKGAQGGVCGGANLMPRLFVDLYEAASAGDSARVDALQAKVLKLGRIYSIGQHASATIKGLKCALSLAGICDDFLAEPFHRFRAEERERVRPCLVDLI